MANRQLRLSPAQVQPAAADASGIAVATPIGKPASPKIAGSGSGSGSTSGTSSSRTATSDHRPLHLGGAADRIDDTREFRQHPVAGILDGTAVMLRDLRINQFAEMRPEPFVRPFLVIAHETRITDHISGEDCGETAGRGHGWAATPGREVRLR